MRLRPSLCSNRAITLHGSLQSAPALILRSKLIIKPDRPLTPTLDSAATDAACLDIDSKEWGGALVGEGEEGERGAGGVLWVP